MNKGCHVVATILLIVIDRSFISGQEPPGNVTIPPPVVTVAPPDNVTVQPPVGTVPPQNVTAAPPIGTAPPQNVTAAPPIGTAPPQNVTAAPPVGTAPPLPPTQGGNGSNANQVPLWGICEATMDCAVQNSVCEWSAYGEGLSRCICQDGYDFYKVESTVSCLKMVNSDTNPNCITCQNNEGICLEQDGTNVVCNCPSSRSGANCEKLHVTVHCANESMTICYEPHVNVDFKAGWSLYTEGHFGTPQCMGSSQATSGYCMANFTSLSLSLNVNDIQTCGTKQSVNNRNNVFSNTIMVSQTRNASITPYTFNVFCSYQTYALGKYTGIGVVSPNGNDRGVEVKANLSLSVVTRYGKPLPEGGSIMVSDEIKFRISLVKDGNYFNFRVLRCLASSSAMMPDSFAETRTLMMNGCPLAGEPTASSWYWTDISANGSYYTMETGIVRIFKMPSSDTVFLYCTIKLCLNSSQGQCAPMTKESCAPQSRKKRAAASDFEATVSAGLRVIDPGSTNNSPVPFAGNTYQSSTSVVLAVVLSVLAVVVIITIIVGTIILKNRKNAREGRQERFAMPKLRNTHQRF